MSQGFQAVVDAQLDGVSEPIIRVVSRSPHETGFKYLGMYAGYHSRPVTISPGPTSLLAATGADQGGYNYTVLTPSRPGIGAVGTYVLQGRFGWLFHPLELDEAVCYADCSCDEFIQHVRDEYSIDLDGLRLGPVSV
jgi:hypothetical protein